MRCHGNYSCSRGLLKINSLTLIDTITPAVDRSILESQSEKENRGLNKNALSLIAAGVWWCYASSSSGSSREWCVLTDGICSLLLQVDPDTASYTMYNILGWPLWSHALRCPHKCPCLYPLMFMEVARDWDGCQDSLSVSLLGRESR